MRPDRLTSSRPPRGDDRGQTSLMLVFGVAALMVMGTTLIVLLGRGMTTETQTRTAADAAALAAAESVTDRVDARLDAMPSDDALAVAHLMDLLRSPTTVLTGDAIPEGRRIASANDTNLSGLDIRATASGFEVSATTTARERTLDGPRTASFDATAQVRITTGALCTRSGGLGLWLGGSCVGPSLIHLEAPPEVEPTPPPEGEDPPPEPEYPDLPWVIVGDDAEALLAAIRNPLTWEVTLTE